MNTQPKQIPYVELTGFKKNLIKLIIQKTIEILGVIDHKTYNRKHSEKRQVVIYLLLSRFTDYKTTHELAGDVFGLDHSTAAYSNKRITDLVSIDPKLKTKINLIEWNVRQIIS